MDCLFTVCPGGNRGLSRFWKCKFVHDPCAAIPKCHVDVLPVDGGPRRKETSERWLAIDRRDPLDCVDSACRRDATRVAFFYDIFSENALNMISEFKLA